jgi:hypothetical protein
MSRRNRAPGKAKPSLFRLFWSQPAAAQRAALEPRRPHIPQDHRGTLPLYRNFGPNRAAGLVSGRLLETETTRPLAQPLVKSLRTKLPSTRRE